MVFAWTRRRSPTSRRRTRRRSPRSGTRPTSCPSHLQWSPRVGINYDLSGNGTRQVRGGIGLFSGRPAYVWISNQFGNTGIDFTRIGAANNAANRIPFVRDPLNQPKTVTGAAAGAFTNEIDVIDPDFKYPSVLRGNVGYDHKMLGRPLRHARLRLVENGQGHQVPEPELRTVAVGRHRASAAGRSSRARITTLSDVILLENTDEGHTWNLAYELRRPFTQRPLRAGRVPGTAQSKTHHGRHVRPGGVELGLRLCAGQPERRAAGAIELRSGSSHHADRQLRLPVR